MNAKVKKRLGLRPSPWGSLQRSPRCYGRGHAPSSTHPPLVNIVIRPPPSRNPGSAAVACVRFMPDDSHIIISNYPSYRSRWTDPSYRSMDPSYRSRWTLRIDRSMDPSHRSMDPSYRSMDPLYRSMDPSYRSIDTSHRLIDRSINMKISVSATIDGQKSNRYDRNLQFDKQGPPLR